MTKTDTRSRLRKNLDTLGQLNGDHKPPMARVRTYDQALAAGKIKPLGAPIVPLTKITPYAVDERHTAALPKAADPDSRTRRIVALKKGECMSEVNRIDNDMSVFKFAQEGSDLRVALRNRMESSVRQAKQRTGNTYMVEVANVFSTQDRLYIVAIVTCLGQ